MGFVLAASSFPSSKLFLFVPLVFWVIVDSLASDCDLCIKIVITALKLQMGY